ncbi:MAG TPA: sigma-70 family RNA polymerase sigma factor [Candidatus Methylomirabilis sp.]|nr:sigma-70 family RNA polymerase sigma factor [Candidatus Methylomirabilis sp.]
MKPDHPERSQNRPASLATSPVPALRIASSTVGGLYTQARASRWGLSREHFAAALERSAQRVRASGNLPAEKVEEYLRGLHLEDLALATACLESCEAAWDHFVSFYRSYLHSAASAVLRCSSSTPEARDLADSLFAELYGLADGSRRERSLLRYFHGRSSLKTWLRAVLAQRHIDSIRVSRRLESLDDEDSPSASKNLPTVAPPPSDPYRHRYVTLFVRALEGSIATLDSRDAQRLRLYYSQEQTLAQIGRELNEHESSVSRNLDRIRAALRRAVEETLRNGCPAANGFAAESGLSEAQVSLCFEYASADAPFDLETLLQPRTGPSTRRPTP